MVNDAKDLGRMIGDLSNRISSLEGNVYPDDPSAQLQLVVGDSIALTDGGSEITKPYPSNSFILDHPVYGDVDSSTLLIDGGYQWENLSSTFGLISYWSQSSNSNDELGNFNGTDTNVTYSSGKNGLAAYFNGSSSKQEFAASNSILNSNSAWSFGCWFWANAFPSDQRVMNFMTTADTTAIRMRLVSPSTLQLGYRDSGGTVRDVNVASSLSTSAWYHAVFTYDGIMYKTYLNGSLATSTVDGFFGFGAGNFKMGEISGTIFLNGRIDEAFAFRRTLQPDEVTAIYNSGTGRFYPMNSVNSTTVYTW